MDFTAAEPSENLVFYLTVWTMMFYFVLISLDSHTKGKTFIKIPAWCMNKIILKENPNIILFSILFSSYFYSKCTVK